MKSLPILLLALAGCLSACTTLENRRDLYSPQTVNGPYTRMLKEGIPQPAPISGEGTASGVSKNVVR